MDREPRYFLPGTLVEVTTVALQNRYLLRPSEELNDVFIGVVGRAQQMYEMAVCCVVALSTHYHMLLIPRDARHLARFMCFVNGNLSKEIGRLHHWPGTMWDHRYHLVPVSDEEAAQTSRLEYLLAAGVKELLVDRPSEWPGVHSATALIEGGVLVGHWYDRTNEHEARQPRGGKDADPEEYATEETIELSPLPCWAHLDDATWRRRVADLVAKIEEDGARERERTGKRSLGVKRILRMSPHRRPKKVEKSPKPRFHAISRSVIRLWREAYREVVRAYREASARFLAGELGAVFPKGTFPPGAPFVPFEEVMGVEPRGQPV